MDKAGEQQIVEFVGLRAKLYSYKMLNKCYKSAINLAYDAKKS